jgi:hypothetical protein
MIPAAPDGKSGAQKLNEEIAQRQAGEKATSDTATQAATDKSAADEAAFQGRAGSAYDTATQSVLNYFRQQGVDPTRYMDTDINPALARSRQSVADLDPNPMSAYDPNLGQSILNNITSGARTRADTAFTAALPTTYANTALGYNAMDPYISDILSSQFDPLSAQLQNASKRGTLNDQGYKAALDALGASRTAAESQVRSLGTGIIDKDRSTINDYISGARTGLGNMSATQLEGFDPTTYTSGAGDIATRELGTLGGDIRSAVGNTKFADLQTLLNQGGSVQGATSGTTPLAGSGDVALDPATIAQQNKNRGLGTQGAF